MDHDEEIRLLRNERDRYAAIADTGTLRGLRATIDNLDAALVHLLAERFKATRKVGLLKVKEGLPAADPGREAEQVARLRELAEDADLDPEFAEKFLGFIVREVIRHHESLAVDGDASPR